MIRIAVKRLVHSIYVMRCGYCRVSEAETGAELTFDHFRPQSQGGSNDADNLVYACHACNEFKGEYFGETEDTRLLPPLRDDLALHLRQEPDGTLQGITPAGQRYIEQLQLNRAPLVLHRLDDWRAEQSVARNDFIHERLDQITARLERIEEQTRSRRS